MLEKFSQSSKRLLRDLGISEYQELLDFIKRIRDKDVGEICSKLNIKESVMQQFIREVELVYFNEEESFDLIKQDIFNKGKEFYYQLGGQTLSDLIKKRQRNSNGVNSIVTFCKDLDQLLGGGVALGEVTEFCGEPGAGKTQMCMQLACNTFIPNGIGGVDGEVVYIDTEGSLAIDRLVEMAAFLIQHLRMQETNGNKKRKLNVKNLKHILNSIHVIRVHDYKQQISAIRSLYNHIEKENKKIKLLILDSVACHFRNDFNDISARTRILNQHAQMLNKLASELNIAVVVTNQVTTKIGDNDKMYFAPALGESWSHAITNRIMIIVQNEAESIEYNTKQEKIKNVMNIVKELNNVNIIRPKELINVKKRIAHLVKSPSQPSGKIEFIIANQGVRNLS
jgi:RecA/RadA recombinase